MNTSYEISKDQEQSVRPFSEIKSSLSFLFKGQLFCKLGCKAFNYHSGCLVDFDYDTEVTPVRYVSVVYRV